MKNIFVGNLAFSSTEAGVRALFEPYGQVDRVNVVTDRDTGRSRGFAFVEMANAEEADRAIAALNGAQLLVLPTNWPEGAETNADHTAITRAMENRIFVATCDRVGEENGFKFIGRSKIVDPSGKVLASADDTEKVLVADLDLDLANRKRVITIPGKYELEVFKARRPELYGDLTRNLGS